MRKVSGFGIFLAAFLIACGRVPSGEIDPPLPVEVVSPATEVEAVGENRFPVTVRRDREADLGFRVAGTIISSPARIGDKLPRGAVIAQLDSTAFSAAATRYGSDVERLARAEERNAVLVDAGAVAAADALDTHTALVAARAAHEAARYDFRSATLRMPFDGVVLSREGEVGSVTGPGSRVARVADLRSSLLARAQVPAAVTATLSVGQLVIVKTGDMKFNGRIRRVGGASDPATGSIPVDIELPRSAQVALGATGSVFIPKRISRPANALILPVEALIEMSGPRAHVFIVEGDPAVARRREVGLVSPADDTVAVTGLPANAKVITSGAGFVRDGQRVVVTRP